MGAYIIAGVVSLAFVAMVFYLSMKQISKGYSYKHSIDPLPEDEKENSTEMRGIK
ncbi:YtzI protein [Oceanobacillus chungangensis]|uniref:YtzI protein n=1 Tax=Oceanobacillus chungangensis TaxID=1229152 RepID=A0A3D8Q0M7_9BACI|nr:YtzI protein [Oceanobacillus chungangensis]RDW21158.1 YtzI protein [Oceanobacillus chungangensis]